LLLYLHKRIKNKVFMNTIEKITEKLGKYLNVTLWTKKGNRLYVNGYGHNTKKCKQTIYIDIDNFRVNCYTDCPSQPSAWCESQSREVEGNLQKYVRYARLIANGKSDAQPIENQIEKIEIEIHNAQLSNQPVKGYYTEWREVRIAINRFGKLAHRNRQFVVAFEGTQENAPRNFVELNDLGFDYIKNVHKGEHMLEPYANVPDYNELAIARLNRITSN
jgi:hypothetical protein